MRAAAVEIIAGVKNGMSLAGAVAASASAPQISAVSRGWAVTLAEEAIKAEAEIDDIIDHYVVHDLPPYAEIVYDILTLGIVEMRHADRNPKIVVSALVEQTKERGLERMSGLVNAVLRRVADKLAVQRAEKVA